jgi:hypothetical protein
MDYDKYIERLWALRWFVAVAIIIAVFGGLRTRYDIQLTKGTMHAKVERFATAQTQVLIDSPRSPITDASLNIAPLAARATLYAAFLRNEEARGPILKAAGLDPTSPVVILGGDQASSAPVPKAAAGTGGIAGIPVDTSGVVFTAQAGLPLVNVRAQAPTLDEAVRLADGAAKGAQEYLGTLQTSSATPRSDRVTVRQLGEATGAVTEQGPGKRAIVTTAIGIAAGLCLLLLIVDAAIRHLRAPRRRGPEEASPSTAG